MFRKIIKFKGDPELLIEILGLDTVEGFSVTEKKESKDVVERSKVIDEMDRYFGEIATKALHDGELPDFDKVLEAIRNFSELSRRIKKIK